jgi:hypothetical protein
MRIVSIPEDLTPLALLEVEEAPPVLRDLLRENARSAVAQGLLEDALTLVERVFSTAWAESERYTAGLALAYQADIHWRLQRWEDALDCTRRAQEWIGAHVTPIARHNEAVAIYFEGLLHYLLHADPQMVQAFTRAQKLLNESERYWSFENQAERIEDSQNLSRWLKNLLDLQPNLPTQELILIVPVYELINQVFVRTQAWPLAPFQAFIPASELRQHLPPELIPLGEMPIPFLQLPPTSRYAAIKMPHAGYLLPTSQINDLLIIEITSPVPIRESIMLETDQPFSRRNDGHIVFRPRRRSTGRIGIPRVLIRATEIEEDDYEQQ